MKNINAVIRFIITAILGLWAFIATAASALPQIADSGAAREYALKKCVRGFRDVSAESIRNVKGQPLYVEVQGDNAEDVLKKLFGKTISYGLDNPEDKVAGRIWLYDESANLLFFGSAEYTKEAFEAGGTPPQYAIWIQAVPILENVRSAELLVIDNDGVTVGRQQLKVDDYGHVLFQPYLAGVVNGLLVAKLEDGSTVTYRLSNVQRLDSEFSETGASPWSISGHHVYESSKDELVVVDVLEVWENPTILITLRAGQTLRLDIKGIVQMDGVVSIERPSNFVYTREEDGSGGSTPGINSDTYTDISGFPAGTYRIRFPANNWVNFAQPTSLYSGPSGGNGKGSETNPSK